MRMVLVVILLGGLLAPASMDAQLSWSKQVINNATGGVWVERADFTGDTFADLLMFHTDTNTTILKNAGGRFDGGWAGAEPLHDIALVDFNRDGKMDILGCSGDFDLLIILGNGDGTYRVAQDIPGGCFGIASADFNHDGRPDIAVTSSGVDQYSGVLYNQVKVYFGDGNGGISGDVTNENLNFNFSNGYRCAFNGSMEAGNFNGDQFPDVAIMTDCASPTASQSALIVGKGDGTGHFTFHKDLETNLDGHMRLRLGDVNQDGHPDLIGVGNGTATNGVGNTAMIVFTGQGNNTFTLNNVASFRTSAGVGDFITAGTVVDLDGDGVKDGIVAVDSVDSSGNHTYSLRFFKGQGNAKYQLAQTFPLGTPVSDITWGDFDQDSRADLALVRPLSTDVWLNQTGSARICGGVGVFPSIYPCYFGSPSGMFHFYGIPRDNRAINAVQIYVDGIVKYVTLDDLLDANVQLSDGPHRITIKAWDDLGPFSNTLTILACTNKVERTVRICTPADGSTINGTTDRITASAFTSRKFVQLQFYTDGRVVGRDNVPYIDQELEPGHGTHRITVKGWDDLGAFSSSVTVTVP
jgi:hypothetical protein